MNLDRIQQQSKSKSQLGMAVLMWTVLVKRRLSLEELEHALAVNDGDTYLDMENIPSEKTILQSCLGMVVVEHETTTVRLMHYSLQEYFDISQYFPTGHCTYAC